MIDKQKHQTGERLLQQENTFSERLFYDNKRIREKYFSFLKLKYRTIEDIVNNIQVFRRKKENDFQSGDK